MVESVKGGTSGTSAPAPRLRARTLAAATVTMGATRDNAQCTMLNAQLRIRNYEEEILKQSINHKKRRKDNYGTF